MNKFLERLEAAAGVVFFLGMFGAISIQIFARYVLGNPLIWPFELSIYCFIYITYIGAGIASRRRSHVSFDLIYDRFPHRAKAAIGILTNGFIIALLCWLMPHVFEYIGFIGSVRSSALQIPWAVVLASFPIGMGLVILHMGAELLENVRKLGGKAS